MKIGDKVNVCMSSCCYDADGEIVGETLSYWRIKITNERTFGKPWKNQVSKVQLFDKLNLLKRGFTKDLKTGDVTSISTIIGRKDE